MEWSNLPVEKESYFSIAIYCTFFMSYKSSGFSQHISGERKSQVISSLLCKNSFFLFLLLLYKEFCGGGSILLRCLRDYFWRKKYSPLFTCFLCLWALNHICQYSQFSYCLYISDFDENSFVDPIVFNNYFGELIPFSDKVTLQGQMPVR